MLSKDATVEEDLQILINSGRCWTVFNIRNFKCTILKTISFWGPMFISIFNNSIPTSQKTDQTVDAVYQITIVFSENLIEHTYSLRG
jgi:hypothetical protein